MATTSRSSCGRACAARRHAATVAAISHRGHDYTDPPVAMIVDAILGYVYGGAGASEPVPYEPPENLGRFSPPRPDRPSPRRAPAVPRQSRSPAASSQRQAASAALGLGMPAGVGERPAPARTRETEAIWQDFHGRQPGFITRRVSDRDRAEDILQDVMLRIHRHAAELEYAPAVGAWVHQIARNAIVDHYRRAPVRRERPGSIDLDRQEQPVFEPPLTEPRSKLAKCLGPLLRRLPAIDREALALTALEASAAARLGLSTSGMKSRVQRPRAQLRPLLVACCENDLDRRGDITSYRSRRNPRDCRMTTPRGVGTVTPYPPACALRRPVLGRSE